MVNTFTHARFIVPSKQCPEEVRNIIAKDPMGNCYTSLRGRGYELLAFDQHEEAAEQVLVVEELLGEEALRVLCHRGRMLYRQATAFREQFGRVFRLHLCGGAKLLYLNAFDPDESQMLLE